jgi:ubiquinone/menaquinone biosynthesis C-methylase UbiE
MPSLKENSLILFSGQAEIDFWESVYNRQDFLGFCYRARMDQALSWLDNASLSRNSTILDAGCGTGVVTLALAQRGYRVFGIDASYGMILKASSVGNGDGIANVQFLQGDVRSLPFQDSSVDAIVCLGVITYFKSGEKVLQELSRVLKPDGILILSILNKTHLIYYLDLPRFINNRFNKTISNRSSSPQNAETGGIATVRRYFIPGTLKSLRRKGYTVTEYKTVPLGLLTFFDHDLPPKKLNAKITLFLEKFSKIPFIVSFGGMCLFKAIKKK